MSHTRFNGVGLAGRKSDGVKTDPFMQQLVIPVTLVASATAQDTGVTLPAAAGVFQTALNIFTAETTGTTKTVSVGFVGGADDALATNFGVTGAGFEVAGNANTAAGGEAISYTLGSADFEELDAEIVLTYVGA